MGILSASDAGIPANGIYARLDRSEKDIEKLDREKAEKTDVQRLEGKVDSLTKAIITFALGLPVAGITFMLGILALVNN